MDKALESVQSLLVIAAHVLGLQAIAALPPASYRVCRSPPRVTSHISTLLHLSSSLYAIPAHLTMSHPIHAIDPVTKHEVTREASAQIAALVAKQEAALRFNKFDAEIAWTVGNVIRDTFIAARKAGKHAPDSGIVIHIETFTGHTLFSCAIGTPPTVGPDNWCVERHRLVMGSRACLVSQCPAHGARLVSGVTGSLSHGLDCFQRDVPLWQSTPKQPSLYSYADTQELGPRQVQRREAVQRLELAQGTRDCRQGPDARGEGPPLPRVRVPWRR